MHIRIIHWKSDEIREQIKRLQNAGHCVDSEIPAGQKLLKSLSQILPDVILIDLSRLPSQGRDLALYLRKNKATRMVPLVFINGKNEIQRDIKNYLPDVFFTDWRHLDSVLKQVVSSPIKTVRVPQSLFEPYKNRKLTQKLGIKDNMRIDIQNGPENILEILDSLPQNVTLEKKLSLKSDLILWFVRSQSQLSKGIKDVGSVIGSRSIWIIWPKRSGDISSDLTQQVVRQTGLDNGLVDFKICSVDTNWSGLLFRRRKKAI